MSAPSSIRKTGFTLVELLIAITILTSVVVLLTSLLSGVSRAWIAGEQQVETFQDGRAILELISREVSQALISQKLQFVQNPTLTGVNQRANSSSLFWQAGLTPTTNGNVCEVGYFLVEDPAQHTFQLKRFFVPPTDATNYQIFANPPSDSAALWVTNFVGNATLNTVVSDGVVAFWVRCMDVNGDAIPWVPPAPPLHFNSGAHFQPAVPSPAPSPNFKYTNPSSTAQAHLLPASVELILVTVDSKTMQRSRASIPSLPVLTGPQDVPSAVITFNQDLVANKVQTARTFSKRLALKNSGQ